MFAQTLALRGPIPVIVLGRIKQRRKPVVVHDTPRPHTFEAVLAESGHNLGRIHRNKVFFWKQQEEERRDFTHDLQSCLRVKVNGRATDGVNRRRFRRRGVRCWKSLCDSQYHSA